MRILLALTYYRPHVSGLTIYVERLARALASRGHEVSVLTSHYSKGLPREERMEGVRVVRVPVLLRVSKGVVMPAFPWYVWSLARESDVVSVHLPQFEGWLLAFLGRHLLHRPVVLTYHCDLELPSAPLKRPAEWLIGGAHHLAGRWADRIVAYTQDYADHSPFLARFPDKTEAILPPVEMPPVEEGARDRLRRELGLDEEMVVVGSAARFAAEKGMEYLLRAIPHLAQELPGVKVLLAGEYQQVIGENHFDRLSGLVREFREHLVFLGVVPPSRMAEFFAACDCLVVASINSTESFGLVQVEAMLCGTPVVATDLPGVRQAILMTGMGEIVPPRDEEALARAIIKVVRGRASYLRPRPQIEALFDIGRTVEAYEGIFRRLKAG